MSYREVAGDEPNGGEEDRTPESSPPVPGSHLEADGELAPGTMVGEFRVEARLGVGGMSTVYSAIQPLIGKRGAIKVIDRQLCLSPSNVQRFIQEARTVNQIGHPNIVDVFAFGTLPDGRSYMVMEWLLGETLRDRLRRGRMPIAEAIAIWFQICDGLAAVHEKGIVHRDLKPENVFVVPVRKQRLLVKVLDFGVAKLRGLGPNGELPVERTAPGSAVGTPKYMSPEQALGRDVDQRADIYSLGVTAFEMLTGRAPFVGQEAIDVMHMHVHSLPPAPSLLREDLPLQLERLLVQMLAKDPAARPTLHEIEARLADARDQLALSGSGPASLRALESMPRPSEPLERAADATDVVDAVSTRRWRLLLAAAVALGLATGVTVALLARARANATAVRAAAPTAAPAAAPPATSAPPLHQPSTTVTTTPTPEPAVASPGAATASGSLRVRANVPDARISVDGRVIVNGAPAAEVSALAEGPHEVVVSAPHHRLLRRTVLVRGGAATTIDATLERQPAATPAAHPRNPKSRDDMIDPFADK